MEFFADPAFFVLLAVVVAVAAVLGLTGHSLQRWGLVTSVVFLACLLGSGPQTVALITFLCVARVCVVVLAGNPGDQRLFYASAGLTMLPLVVYKLTASSVSLWGFAGISYVTFKALQVVFEVHDGLIGRDELGIVDYLSFLLFFPQFISGPIDRSRRFLADAHRVPPRDEYAGMLARGILLLLAGMGYKLVLAQLAQRWWVLEPWGDGPFLAELANQVRITYAYAAYLFFDFAGYSLMAMGASYCLGIRCPRNFRAPFLASDVIDFWNRWHITLSTWFRDFVFMRLTRTLMLRGRRRGWRWARDRVRVAQVGFVADMLAMGCWHGLTADYLGYGLYHGVLLAANEWLQKRSGFYRAHRRDRWMRALMWFVTLQLVMLGFAIFSGQVSYLVKGALNG